MEKKQGCVDWLVEEINKQKAWAEPSRLEPIIQQAKAMHKEEIRVAYMDGAFEKIRHLDGKEFIMPTDYYNETFGGNNE